MTSGIYIALYKLWIAVFIHRHLQLWNQMDLVSVLHYLWALFWDRDECFVLEVRFANRQNKLWDKTVFVSLQMCKWDNLIKISFW